MESAVQFRILSNQLTDTEHALFINQIFQHYDKRQFMDTAITHLLINQVKNNKNKYYDKINKIMANIIDQRDKNKSSSIHDSESKSNKVNINDLPSTMISHCASYLQSNEIIKFINCSRYIYISCVKTPTTFITMNHTHWMAKFANTYNLYQYNDHKNELLNKRYRRLHHVTVSPRTFNQIYKLNKNIWKWTHLKFLGIAFLKTEGKETIEFMDIFAKYLENTNIEYLVIEYAASPDITKILQFISNNKNIQFLRFRSIQIQHTTSIDNYSVLKQFKKLKEITFMNVSIVIIDRMLSQISDRLQTLTLENCGNIPFKLNDNYTFSELTSLSMTDLNAKCMVNIIDRCKMANLENIYFYEIQNASIGHGITTLFEKIIECKNLTNLTLPKCVHTQLFFDHIKNALAKCDEKTLYLWRNLKIWISSSKQEDIDYIINNFDELLCLINKVIGGDWMLIMAFDHNEFPQQTEKIKIISEELANKKEYVVNHEECQLYTLNRTIHEYSSWYKFCISNKNNKMCGYF